MRKASVLPYREGRASKASPVPWYVVAVIWHITHELMIWQTEQLQLVR